jgi:hypothetical protein
MGTGDRTASLTRRHVGASIHEAWTTSLESVRTALDVDPAHFGPKVLPMSSE